MSSFNFQQSITNALSEARFFVPEGNQFSGRFPDLARVESERVKKLCQGEALAVRPAISEAERYRLVEGSKCPTRSKPAENTPAPEPETAFERLARENDAIVAKIRSKEQRQWMREMENAEAFGLSEPAALPHNGYVQKPLDEIEFKSGGWRYDLREFDFETGEVPKGERLAELGAQKYTVVSHRAWSNEFRIRTQVEQPGQLPPEQFGPRISDKLSLDAARKISDSCMYMHLNHEGYRTFLTLTFDDQGRSRVEIREAEGRCVEVELVKGRYQTVQRRPKSVSRGSAVDRIDIEGLGPDGPFTPVVAVREKLGGPVRYYAGATRQPGADMTFTTVQSELSRFLDGMQKMRQRGWKAKKRYPWGEVTCYRKEGQMVGEKPSKVVGIKGHLADKKIGLIRQGVGYSWVVENPRNDDGKRNPHVHIMIDWRVKYAAFAAWADRLESLWGQGFAHIEKIKESEKAGAYLAKAAGYLSKAAGESDQGPVRGNRYGISKLARAPEWECLGRYELGIMGHLIADVYDYWSHLYGGLFKVRKDLATELEETPKEERAKRQSIGSHLEAVRSALGNLPAISSKYQLVIRGIEPFKEFVKWARSPEPTVGNMFLPAKEAGDCWDSTNKRPEGQWYTEFQFRMHAKRFARRAWGIPIELYEKMHDRWVEPPEQDLSDWLLYSEFCQ